jgi:hypothetical protein
MRPVGTRSTSAPDLNTHVKTESTHSPDTSFVHDDVFEDAHTARKTSPGEFVGTMLIGGKPYSLALQQDAEGKIIKSEWLNVELPDFVWKKE